jgi:serine/threonine-protein kinase
VADLVDRLKTALADRYRVDREIGRGGMAHVFLAHDLKLDRPIALKVLRPDLAAVLGGERFLREITLAAKLEHPHILGIHDSGQADGILYYVMPYVEGESLRDRLKREKQLPLDDALQISREVADALSYAHSRGVIHRDIKPENILLEVGHAVVADFGIARAIDAAGGEKLTETGVALGTPQYMSPEQAGGSKDLDGRSDLYSLGCVLYEMLVGQPPFTGPTIESVVAQHLSAPPPDVTTIRPSVPSWVVAALLRSLAKAPADRFNPVAQFGEAIAPRLSVADVPTPSVAPPSRRSWVMLGAAAAAALLVAGWFGRGLLMRESAPRPLIGVRPYTIVAVFDGTADDEVRRAAQNLLSTALGQSGVVAVLPDDQLRQAYRLAGKPDTLTLGVALARELAVRGAIRTVVAGTVDRVGRTYHLAVRVLDADSGTAVAAEREVAEDEDDVIPRLDGIARSLREALGEQPARVAATRVSREVITPSFEAFRWYQRAQQLTGAYEERSHQQSAAREAYGQALLIDPDFAAAWSGLSVAFWRSGYRDSALWATDQALARPERQTEGDRVSSLGLRAWIRRDPAAASEYDRRAVEEFGRSPNNLGNALEGLGRFAEAAALMDQWERIAPFGPAPVELYNHARWLAMVGRYDEARERADRLPANPALRTRFWLSSQAGEWVAAESLATQGLALGDAVYQPYYRAGLAAALAARGRVGVALQYLRQNVSAYRPGSTGDEHLLILALALSAGLPLDARDGSKLAAHSSPEGMTVAAIWYAAVGDTVDSRRLVQSVRARSPDDRRGLDSALTLAEAWIAAAGGRWSDVQQMLGTVAARGVFLLNPRINLLTRWLVAEADVRLGVPDTAAAMFERIATWSGFSVTEAVLRGLAESFAHQRLVLLYGRMGRLDDARRHWKIFSETFTQPDPEVAHFVDEARTALDEAERKAGR